MHQFNSSNQAFTPQAQQPASSSTQGSQHITHLSNASNPSDPYEKFAINFQLPSAIIWQIKFILSGVTSKKSLSSASAEFSTLAEGFGKEFDKYLLKELMDQIDIKDASKASKDKLESIKITLLNQEITRASLKPEFLSFFHEIMESTYGQESGKPVEFLQEITKRLKLNAQTQILIALSLIESTEDKEQFDDLIKYFRQKLGDFHANGKPEQLPEYAAHRILYLFDAVPELSQDAQLYEVKSLLIATAANRFSQFTPLRASLHQDISQVNCHNEMMSFNVLREGCGLEDLEFVHKMIQPWEVLIDIGHSSSYMYDFLFKTLQEFKNIDEKVMALTILQLSINHTGKDDHVSKIVYNTLESNKQGNPASIRKEPEDKKTQMSWSIDNLARAFRELYSTLNWNKVFESFGENEDHELPPAVFNQGLDIKQFQTLLQLFNKSKPQNVVFPLLNLLSQDWRSSVLQLTFIKNCMVQYVHKKDKSILFNKLKNKTQTISDLAEIKERGEPTEVIDVWQSVDLVERLIILSETSGLYKQVRKVFDNPLKQLPEYLLLSLSLAKPPVGNVLLDEILSILMPIFLGNHINSSIVLQKLFELNSALFITGICELCKHDQRLMNLSRVLDITQEVKDSLLAIVYCQDYNFAVHLGILAGKRDFLHYDVWIQSRIKDVGTPFINALIKYFQDLIIIPVSDFVQRNQALATAEPETFELQKNAILERSHLTKDKLILTIEHLQSLKANENDKILRETEIKIRDLVSKSKDLFPQHYEPGQNSEAIDAAANEHFQKVFSAEDDQVDARIEELIRTMQAFKESPDVQEQEIYACMLHGLFDEYRFLHRYPPQYLTKIAKLFGAIIKNRLLDRVLQDIALKFVIEAFRRDGRRQTFGIIVIKSFFSILHQFPKFLEDIYQMRANIEASEPQMMADIARLHQEMVQNNSAGTGASVARSEMSAEVATHDSSDEHHHFAAQIADRIDAEENKQISEGDSSSILSVNSARLSHQGEGLFKKQENLLEQKQNQGKDSGKKGGQSQRGNTQQQTNQTNPMSKSNQKNQRNLQNNAAGNPSNQNQNINQQQMMRQGAQQNSMTPPLLNQAKEFVPSNKTIGAGQPTSSPMVDATLATAKAFVPSGKPQFNQLGQQQPSQLHDHTNIPAGQNTNQQSKTKAQLQTGALHRTQTVPTDATATSSSLNISSAEFKRPMSSQNGIFEAQKQININAKEFMPPRLSADPYSEVNKNIITQSQIQELIKYKEIIDGKMKKASDSGGKVRLAELLDDESITVENEYVEDEIRKICNHTDRGNFKQKIEDLKKFVIKKPSKIDENGIEIPDEKSEHAEQHLRWFVHCILTKRLGSQGAALQSIYIEMIRELNNTRAKTDRDLPSVINQTIDQASQILKKCLIIDEEEFMKVTNLAQGAASIVKSYLCSLGTFIGSLTIAKNEPIRGQYLDLKQILIEGFQNKNRRLVVAFVSRILKEAQHSRVFTPKNPWVSTLLQMLREIYDFSQPMQSKQHHAENLMEIDSLFKCLNLQNFNEIKPHGILQNLDNPGNFCDPAVRRELDHIYKKNKIILPSTPAPPPNEPDTNLNVKTASTINPVTSLSGLGVMGGIIPSTHSDTDLLRQQMSQISRCVSVSAELTQILTRFKNFNEQKIRRLVGNAVDNSIVEILPPVVDRSVTIALITTRELVLKDFAYDGDYKRVLKAADLIVQNLAGSLALVTCREPLRMSLTTNLKKIFDQHFRMELGIEIITGSSNPQPSDTEQTTGSSNVPATESTTPADSTAQLDSNGFQTSVTEDQINDFAVLASKENLELGCKLIKKEVIEKALKKVREDPSIIAAVENRKQAEERGIRPFRDTRIVAQFQELPPQLQPNQNGLTAAQFQVYEDFHKLGEPSKDTESISVAAPQNLTSILRLIDQYGLTEVHKVQLVNKIQQMNVSSPTDEEREKLWTYVQRNLETACKNYDSRNPQGVEQIIQILSLIVSSYTVENFSKKLLTNVFLQLDVRIFNEVELNILLMSKKIISISEWDRQLAIFFKESAAQLPEPELQFFYNFLSTSIVEMKILTKEEVPQLISVIEEKSHDPKIGTFCKYILETLNFQNPNSLALQGDQNTANLREFFIKWVVMSYVDDKSNQEKQINTLFKDLGGMGIDSDPKLLFSFCKVMVQTSIEKSLVFGDGSGEKRPVDRLDFRYIDSFVKLIVVLLKMFQLNKHEFMTKVLEFIGEVLDEDHRIKKAQFNQRPYYRMLMNILTAVNHSDCFNQKTQKLILFSMSDLFQNLNPTFYPAFCFSWLELISHKQFLPHFLKITPIGTNSQQLVGFQGANSIESQAIADSDYFEKRSKIKELIVSVFTFLKNNMIPGVAVTPAIQAFYHGTLRVISVIRQDFPDFLSDFHFHFVNCMPEHCIQLKNIILSACPSNIQEPDPFHEDLKIDLLMEIQQNPRILSNYDNYLSLMNLREDLDNYYRTRNPQLIIDICRKMEQSEEIVNGRRKINSYVISAVVLYLANQGVSQNPNERTRPSRDTFKQIVQRLNDETRLCFLNAIVNELRYPSRHTFDFSCTILSIYAEAGREIVFEQISQIFLERLQTCGPYPWGLMISFRELIQNPKLEFMKKQYIRDHPNSISRLFQGRLKNFIDFIPAAHRGQLVQRSGSSGNEQSTTPPPPGPTQVTKN